MKCPIGNDEKLKAALAHVIDSWEGHYDVIAELYKVVDEAALTYSTRVQTHAAQDAQIRREASHE